MANRELNVNYQPFYDMFDFVKPFISFICLQKHVFILENRHNASMTHKLSSFGNGNTQSTKDCINLTHYTNQSQTIFQLCNI